MYEINSDGFLLSSAGDRISAREFIRYEHEFSGIVKEQYRETFDIVAIPCGMAIDGIYFAAAMGWPLPSAHNNWQEAHNIALDFVAGVS